MPLLAPNHAATPLHTNVERKQYLRHSLCSLGGDTDFKNSFKCNRSERSKYVFDNPVCVGPDVVCLMWCKLTPGVTQGRRTSNMAQPRRLITSSQELTHWLPLICRLKAEIHYTSYRGQKSVVSVVVSFPKFHISNIKMSKIGRRSHALIPR